MRFDKTFIAIRDRSILEILDLSLHVVADHIGRLFWLWLIGVVPWVALDLWLIGGLIDSDEGNGYYFWVMLCLIVSQAQVGTSFITHYLGQAMFVGRPGIWDTFKGVFKTSPYFIFSHGVLRLVIPTVLACLLLNEYDLDVLVGVGVVLIPLIVGTGLLVRSLRPFVSEILLLERTPIRSKDENQVHFSRRSKSLHGAAGSDLLGRFLTAGMAAIPLGFAAFSMFVTIDSVLNIRANSDQSYLPYYWIIALWIIAGLMSVVRFLSYIDIRIRQEGWAVELRMRAEGQLLMDNLE